MPKLDIDAIEQTSRTGYPMPYAAEMGRRHYRRIGAAGGLTQLGVSHVVLDPGGVSSQRSTAAAVHSEHVPLTSMCEIVGWLQPI